MNNGVEMPMLGYGVYQVDPADCERCVTDALEVGYRSIDTAQAYYNEEGVGKAIAKSGIAREDLFITTKIWISNAGEQKAADSIKRSLEKLDTDYIDLLLIHQPFSDYYGTYRAMEKAYADGLVHTIGVSNFLSDRLADICNFAEVTPAVDQVETHVFQQQKKLRRTLDKYGVAHMAWGQFAEGKNGYFTNPVLAAIGAKYGKSTAQVALRFLIQNGVIVIPKSTHMDRMRENLDVFDFTLDHDDMDAIAALDEGKSLFFDHHDGESIEGILAFGKQAA
ncbi:Oxidoreductase, Aldo/keto reductase family protein [Bifidobacterium magnum]|uniref:Oxidoreductase, Aldo/keto reductase family protein n=1 Tax=Bifidobacterium magnum TaxID=1692 RepID=A0A087BE66_9BIFI|nr:Oxidoreductase, Aldo/keto reductase family protein [Bifidobacterium magnum]